MPRKALRHFSLTTLVPAVRRASRGVFQETFGVPWREEWVTQLRQDRDTLILEDLDASDTRRSQRAAAAILRKHGVSPDGDPGDLAGHSPRIGRLFFGLGEREPPKGQGTDLPRFTDTRSYVINAFEVLRVSVGFEQPTKLQRFLGAGREGVERFVARRAIDRQLAALVLLIDERQVIKRDEGSTAAEVVRRIADAVARARKRATIGLQQRWLEEVGATEPLRVGEVATWFPPEPGGAK
jgi:hypothetical protein